MKETAKRPKRESVPRKRDGAPSANSADWQERTMTLLRELILAADPEIVEEQKWKKPSNPEGVPVWSRDGIICIGNTLKSSVRLTFPYGAELPDPKKVFNTRFNSKTVRGVDFFEGDPLDPAALQALVRHAVRVNGAIQAARRARAATKRR